MPQAVTAIYRTHAIASLVREELERLGIGREAITVLPDARPEAEVADGPPVVDAALLGFTAMSPLSGVALPGVAYVASVDRGGLASASERLHDLSLPEEDIRTYREAIRNGDHVVSVRLDGSADLARIREVMRRPEEARDPGRSSSRRRAVRLEPRRELLDASYDESWTGGRGKTTPDWPHTGFPVRTAMPVPSRRGG